MIEQLCGLMLADPTITLFVIVGIVVVLYIIFLIMLSNMSSLHSDVQYYKQCCNQMIGRYEEVKAHNNTLKLAMYNMADNKFQIFIDGEEEDEEDLEEELV